jgi:hypothetical protein
MSRRQIIPTLSRYALLILVTGMLAWTGCDSNDDEDDGGEGDADLMVGTWDATAIKAGPIDVLGMLGLSMTLTMEANGDARIDAGDTDGALEGVTGTYVVDEQVKTITLDGDDVEDDLVLEYVLLDANTMSVDIEGSDLGNLGFDLGEFGELVGAIAIKVDLARHGA